MVEATLRGDAIISIPPSAIKEQEERVFGGDRNLRLRVAERVAGVPKIMLASPDHPLGERWLKMYRESGFDVIETVGDEISRC